MLLLGVACTSSDTGGDSAAIPGSGGADGTEVSGGDNAGSGDADADSQAGAEPSDSGVGSDGPGDPGEGTGGSDDGAATEETGAAPSAPGYFHTEGASIVDSDGHPVRLTGLNWFGLETETFVPHGLWARSMDEVLDQVAGLGYRVLRLPFSSEALDDGSQVDAGAVDFFLNPQLQGLTPIEVMDAVVDGAGARGLRVILDRHRPSSTGQSELWYTDQYPEDRWISDWEFLAQRYLGDDTVIGVDLHNEPHGPATWGDGNPATDWREAAQRAGNAVLSVNPDLLIVVEGIEQYDGHNYWWGGNLRGARAAPVQLERPNQLVYSPHLYPPSLFAQPWFSDLGSLPATWSETWGYLAEDDIAPILIGEFGSMFGDEDAQWLSALAGYIDGNELSFTYWCLNPNSGDTGGLLQDDWTTIHDAKHQLLAPLLAPL